VNPRTPESRLTIRPGIRSLLLFLLLPGIILLLVIDSWNDYQTLTEITNEAYDTALLEPARILESSVEINEEGELRVSTPLYAQVMLESNAGVRKYYRVEEILLPALADVDPGPGGRRAIMGMADLPHPLPWPVANGAPLFFDAEYRKDPIRAVAILRDIYQHGAHHQVLVMVAESIAKREATESAAREQEFWRDARMLLLVFFLIWWGVAWAVKPLVKLRNEIRARSPDDLTPLSADRVPGEVVPLVEAVNHHIARQRKVLDEQAQFLADASHQLRTPLAIMLTQAQYTLREQDEGRRQEGLRGIVVQLRRTRRLTEQLLALAHASQGEDMPSERFDLNSLARDVVLQYLPLAHEKRQDLGWVGAEEAVDSRGYVVPVQGSEVELHETVSNLVHNAINYAPPNARITVSVARLGARAEVQVVDNGPGVAADLRGRAFERFDRARPADAPAHTGGSGLGLAIARAYARRNGGDVELRDGEANSEGGKGLCAVLWVPFIRDNPSIQVPDSG
jgi:two-component system sensor histidine kinase TctE